MVEYVNSIVEELARRNIKAEVRDVRKNNGVELTGIVVSTGTMINPTMYVNDFYNNNTPINEVVRKIESALAECKENQIEELNFSDYNWVKDRLIYRVVNLEMNKNLSSDMVTQEFPELNLMKEYRVMIERDGEGTATTSIAKNYLDLWGVTEEEVKAQAEKNIESLEEYSISTIGEVLGDLIGVDALIPMYVGTNKAKCYGASIIFSDKIGEFAEKVNDDVVIIPSSVHEIILLPYSVYDMDNPLTLMITEINESMVSPDERLNNNPYIYKDGVISLLEQ